MISGPNSSGFGDRICMGISFAAVHGIQQAQTQAQAHSLLCSTLANSDLIAFLRTKLECRHESFCILKAALLS